MSVRWKTITDRLHKESGLRDTTNEVGTILDSTIGESLDRYDEYLDTATLQGFLLTSSGDYLDEHGLEYGVKRLDNEDDLTYRQRILNKIDLHLTVYYCKNQGLYLYTEANLHDDIRNNLSSMNPTLSNKYVAIPKTSEANTFIKQQVIYEHNFDLYAKGWNE